MIMRNIIPILLLTLLPSFATNGFGQIFRNYTVEDGLPTNEIYECVQDKKGFVWFGTSLGVSRYDGYKFKNFTTLDGLPDNTIFGFFEDSKGRIWFRSFNGLIAYYYQDKIINVNVSKELRQNHISGITEKKDNSILIQYIDGTVLSIKFDSNEKPKVTLNCKCDITVSNLIKQSNSILAENCLDYYNFEQHQGVKQFRNYGDSQVYIERSDVYLSNDGFLTHRKINLEGVINGAVYRSSKNGHLFIPTLTGYVKYSGDGFDKVSRRVSNLGQCSAILEDSQGGFWVTSTDKGVYYCPNQDVSIRLTNENISHLEYYQNALHLAVNESKILRYENGLFHEFLEITDDPRIVKSFNGRLIISENESFVVNPNFKIKNSKERILCYQNNSYWIASSNGELHEYDIELNKINSYVSTSNSRSTIRRIYPNKESLFIVRLDGVEKFNLDTKEFTNIYLKTGKTAISVSDILTLENEWDLFCTLGEGIIIKNGNRRMQILQKDGLASNIIFNATKQSDSIIWVSTPGGVSKVCLNFSKENSFYTIYNYTKHDGLSSNFVNDIAIFHDSVFIATNNGLNIIPSTFKIRTYNPLFSIHSCKVNGRSFKHRPSALSYNENNFVITYGAIHFPSENNITYKYRLRGVSNQWFTTKEKKLQFLNLNPGSYAFEMFAVSSNGMSKSAIERIHFQIKPPIYQEWWFKMLFVFTLLIIIWLIVRFRLKLIRKKLTLKYELEKLKGIALRSQLNPHFIFNALNSIQNYIANNNNKDSLRYLAKFSRLIRIILESSEKEIYTLEEEIDFIRLYLDVEKMRFTDKLEYEIVIDKSIRVDEIVVPSFILQPYVENAIWHGIQQKKETGTVTIKALKNGNDILLQIIDDGVGLPDNNDRSVKNNKSLGLSLSASRLENHAELMNENITVTVQNNPDQGVSVTILIKGQ